MTKKCPKCGGLLGWYEKRILYYEQYFDWSGEPIHHEGGNTCGGKRKYCGDCGKDITDYVNEVSDE